MIEKLIRIGDIEYRVTGGIKIPPYTDAIYEVENNGIKHYEKARWNEIMEKKITGVIIGIVTYLNCCHEFAPSIDAASYNDRGTSSNPAK